MFNYTDVPENYICSQCGRANCKLWRQYQTFLDNIQLLCVVCALKDQNKLYKVSEDGTHSDEDGIISDQIAWLVPAIPTEDNQSFWGYTSVPELGVRWWKNLSLGDNNVGPST